MSALQMLGTVLTSRAAMRIGGCTHLVGLLLSGHGRISAGRRIITSPVVVYSEGQATDTVMIRAIRVRQATA